MKKLISACGNDCNQCPRHLPKSEDELRRTAELWYKIGYRDRIVSTEEISCSGCTVHNWCRYGIISCGTSKGIATCGDCLEYPCHKITECFSVTTSYESECVKHCSPDEFQQLKKASFEKQKNLDIIASKYTKYET